MRSKSYFCYIFAFILTFQLCFGLSIAIGEEMKDNSNPASYKGLTSDEFMKKWLILGPISIFKDDKDQGEELQKKAYAEDFLSQYGGEAGIKPSADMVCKIGDKDLQWKFISSDEDIIDLVKIFGQKDYAIAYAYADIDMPSARKAFLGVGSDDAIRIWLNGKLIHEKWLGRGVNKDDDFVPIDLQKGANHLLLKIQNMQMAWGFVCRELGKTSLNQKLTSATSKGLLDDVEMLLSAGVDVNATDEIGLTALHRAEMSGRKDVMDLLIKKGADPNIKMPDKEKLADAVFNAVFKGDSAGASVLVARDGKIIYQKGFGHADIGNHVPFTVDTKSRIGSITKQFTASAILKLQEEGKISINDKLSKFIPDFPRGDEVTIHHLLTHTSGIHSFTSKADFLKNATVEIKSEDMINSIKKDPYDFNPGEKFLYNNSGYFILGYIIEKISGESYENYLKKTFFDPLGMKDTGVHNSHTIYEHEAYGYSYENGKFQKAVNWDMSQAGGAGSIYSTVGDLCRWNEGIFNGKALSKASLDSAFTPVKLNDGSIPKDLGGGYGYGWLTSENRGLKVISHGGGLNGFNSDLRRYVDINATVVALQNCVLPAPGTGANELAGQISEIFFWEDMKPQESIKVDKTVSASKYDDYIGRYDYSGTIMKIRRDGDRLLAQLAGQPEFEIFPKSENEFFWKVVDAQVTFVRNEKGEVTHVLHHQGGSEINAPKLKDETSAKVDPAIYDQYVGEYSFNIPQMEAIKITKEGDKLFAQATGQPKIELFPRSESEFFSDVAVIKVNFIKDSQGKVTKMVINQSGMTIEGAKK
jgi:CubicO group peptidase (beta-lactamase class C family)